MQINGTVKKITHTFPGRPIILMVAAKQGLGFSAWRGMNQVYLHYQSNGTVRLQLTWGETNASWYYDGGAQNGLNASGQTYQIAALLDMNA